MEKEIKQEDIMEKVNAALLLVQELFETNCIERNVAINACLNAVTNICMDAYNDSKKGALKASEVFYEAYEKMIQESKE